MQHSVNLVARLACLFTVAALCFAPCQGQAQEPLPRLEGDPFAPSQTLQGTDPFLFDINLFDSAQHMEELCRQALAAATCKPEGNYNFVREQEPTPLKSRQGVKARTKERVLVFSGFYGASNAQFYCQTDDRRISISSEAWGSKRITVPYEQDQEKRCLKATVSTEACGGSKALRVCDEQR
ncbi:hypothetical protein [Desulfocurvibacter africanus]|uniref:hypothetical protein n=1 Tax=Desulfocurvibacter africanus TaxID=873 RepID=UPI0004831850|nr:hypothetical protein [Desulfocurvibacter africanus]